MKLLELKHLIEEIIENDADAVNADVLVDTEARRYNAHMIDVKGCYHLEKEAGLGNAVYLTIDYSGSDI